MDTPQGGGLGFCLRVMDGSLMIGFSDTLVPCPHCLQKRGTWVLSATPEGDASAVCGRCRRRFTHPNLTADLITSLTTPDKIWESLEEAETEILGGKVVA